MPNTALKRFSVEILNRYHTELSLSPKSLKASSSSINATRALPYHRDQNQEVSYLTRPKTVKHVRDDEKFGEEVHNSLDPSHSVCCSEWRALM
ncbi:hypothetical protein QE152_g39212 [Popillia japonica]|uniref:Uncharacterized protein n=1 Tax=Popillia japonica TaxID=7064 RepID=A0AAW1HUL9_POPJA